ncbi:hypothetical protein N866_13605 [Actinotalea ferrariae CF5-4]|uniref:Uncharacterized protein n=1 Tax=Actinotalea ferrariae CF5-4 TaxID=948458 RepID=A0A021VSW5_9CELL|nr:hypothetical protein [Actinotalea ferrariae]EYR64279.1 hypothetical protein N866_13605 [Actinotalea ferrariae CF5-4]
MTDATDWFQAAAVIAGALLALAGVWQKILRPAVRRLRAALSRANRALDVVLGSPAVPDPDRPGELLRPEQPDIGIRMTRQEALLEDYIRATTTDAAKAAEVALRVAEAAREDVATLAKKVDDLTDRVDQWQSADRTKAEVATSVLHEMGMELGRGLTERKPNPVEES